MYRYLDTELGWNWHETVIFPDFPPDFYGMKRARVGAFTDFGTF